MVQYVPTNKKLLIYLFIPLFIFTGFSAMTTAIAEAADCTATRKKVVKERNLFKKYSLLEQSIHDCASDPVINFQYAYALERLRKYGDALKYYIKASTLDAENSAYHFGMADMYVILGNGQSAILAYEKDWNWAATIKELKRNLILYGSNINPNWER